MSTQGFDHTVDWLVVGSGAGAMVSAIVAHDLGATTLLLAQRAVRDERGDVQRAQLAAFRTPKTLPPRRRE